MTASRLIASGDISLGGLGIAGKSAVMVPLTGSTTETVMGTVTIPANAIGVNGLIKIISNWSGNNNANNKNIRIRLGGIGGSIVFSSSITTGLISRCETIIQNRNSAASQYLISMFSRGTDGLVNSAVNTPTTVDTTVNQDIVLTGQLTVSTDTLNLESFIIEFAK